MSCMSNNSSSPSFIPEPNALRIARTVLFSLIAALALVGNYVVCRAVWRNPGPKPIAHYLVSNLAFAEIVSMVCLVFTFHAYEPPYSWKLGRVMCKILEPLQIASLLVVTTTLAILAVYRCVLLIKPVVRKPTRRVSCRVILVSWVGSVGLTMPAGHFRVLNSYGYDCEIHLCEEVFPEGYKLYQDVYTVVLFIINFAFPFVIMAISYFFVTKKIRQHIFVTQRHRDEQCSAPQLAVVVPSTCIKKLISPENQEAMKILNIGIYCKTEMMEENMLKQHDVKRGISPKVPQNQNVLRERDKLEKDTSKLENDILKMVYALILIFGICYIPYQLQFLMYEFKFKAFKVWPHRYTFSRFVFTITCLPSALHPLFYGMMSKFYRKAFIRIFSCRR